jgi:hypothetical protein
LTLRYCSICVTGRSLKRIESIHGGTGGAKRTETRES